MGYDGKGQVAVDGDTAPGDAWRRMGAPRGILEDFVDFRCEVSVIVARGADGAHRRLSAGREPPRQPHPRHDYRAGLAAARDRARRPRRSPATSPTRLDLVGVLAVEMFVTKDGTLLVNELAPRPHNSGHWTIDACATSQFEQLVRAICGLPLGSTERHADAVMNNLIGDEVGNLARRDRRPDAPAAPLRQSAPSGPAARWATSPGCCRAVQTTRPPDVYRGRRSASARIVPQMLIAAQNSSITTDGKFHSKQSETRISAAASRLAKG